ncbi:MAG TPA: SBBP repeat-containing protein [Verrucomicrobiae bacterium]|nr:SBBP repeat-containing protein [Verrucomicrobiae bacterium]
MNAWTTSASVCVIATVLAASSALAGSLARGFVGLPAHIEPNIGQADPAVQFLARGPRGNLFLTRNKAWLTFPSHQSRAQQSGLGLTFAGGNFTSQPEPSGELPGKANYFFGAETAGWLTNIPTFSRVRYRGIYPGVDAVFYANAESLEYDLILQPGVDPGVILLQFEGADKITLDADGDLEIQVGKLSIRQPKPTVYQEILGQRRGLTGRYQLHSGMQVGIWIADYDASQPIVIDPVLNYSATLGGTGVNNALAVAVDPDGNVYVTGNTAANNFPTKGAYQATFAGDQDAFVTKLDTNGVIVYSTYLGGGILNNINQGSSGQAIAVDGSGDAFIAGWTQVTNFPVKNALQATNSGNADAFVAELNPSGNGLVFSTYLGGNGMDVANGIGLDTNANILITGYTESTNLPMVAASQPVYAGNGDAFVAKLGTDGKQLIYSTYLGGSDSENNAGSGLLGFPTTILPLHGGAITVDLDGNAYVTGWTFSTNFPTLNPIQPTNNSSSPMYNPVAFVTKIGSHGNLLYSTYFGGKAVSYGSVYGRAIGVNINDGAIYVAGSASVPNLPITSALQSYGGAANAQTGDGFIAAFDSTGKNLIYCTYLGGTGDEQINGLAVRPDDGALALIGSTSSADFPLTNAFQVNGKQGLFNSTNGAANWSTPTPALSGSTSVYAILADPFDSAVVYTVTANGFFKSLDGGATWAAASSGLGYFSAPFYGQGNNELAADPLHPGVIYIGCYDGVFKTTNGAASWFSAGPGLPTNPDVQAIAVDPQKPSTIYAGLYHGLYKSTDGGNTLSVATNGLNNFNVTALVVDPLNSSNVLVGVQNFNNTCLFKSRDAGATWAAVNTMPADAFGEHTIVAFAPYRSAIYAIVGNIVEDANLEISTNGGATWSSQFIAQGLQFTTLAVGAPSVSSPALSIAFSGANDVLSWPAAFASYALQFSPSLSSPNWRPVSSGGVTSVTNPATGAQGFYRLVGTNSNSSSAPTLYLGTDAVSGQGVLKSVDGGINWNPVGFPGVNVSALAVDSSNPSLVYAGLNGKNTAFAATLDPAGHLSFATFLGGSGNDSGNAIALLDEVAVAGVGVTTSTDFPTNAVSAAVVPAKLQPRKGGPRLKDSDADQEAADTFLFILAGVFPCPEDQLLNIDLKVGQQYNFYPVEDGVTVNSRTGSLPAGIKPFLSGLTGTPTAAGSYTYVVNFNSGQCNWKVTFNFNVTN